MRQTIDTSIPNSLNYIIGEVTGHSYLFGMFLTILKQPVGLICLIILPCFVIILIEVIKIINALGEGKKIKEKQEKEAKDNELEELRRRLAELENAKSDYAESDK